MSWVNMNSIICRRRSVWVSVGMFVLLLLLVYIYIYMMFGCNLARHLHFEVSHV